MKIVAWIVGIIVVGFLLMLAIGASMSDETTFKLEAQKSVEDQVGGDASARDITVHDIGNGELTACGSVLYTPKFAGPLGLTGKISSEFFVGKGGVVMIGVGPYMGVVSAAHANGCRLADPETTESNQVGTQ
jgi:hypothetical protein